MTQQNNKLIPGQALIYERSKGVVYARYRDSPYNNIPRWVVGGDPTSVAKANGSLYGEVLWDVYQDINRIAKSNVTLKKQLNKLLATYYIVKDEE